MSIVFIILIIITQINYLYFYPSNNFRKKNLKDNPKKNNERKLDDRSDDIVIIHLNTFIVDLMILLDMMDLFSIVKN